MKAHGFTDLREFQRFMRALAHAVEVTHYDLDAVVPLLKAMEPPAAGPTPAVQTLKQIARDWMDDVHDYCNVAHHTDALNPEQTAFNRAVRAFRKTRPWLRDNFSDEDALQYRAPTDGTVLFYGLRHAPDSSEHVLFVGSMEGASVTTTPIELPLPELAGGEWRVALSAPSLHNIAANAPLELADRQAALFTREIPR